MLIWLWTLFWAISYSFFYIFILLFLFFFFLLSWISNIKSCFKLINSIKRFLNSIQNLLFKLLSLINGLPIFYYFSIKPFNFYFTYKWTNKWCNFDPKIFILFERLSLFSFKCKFIKSIYYSWSYTEINVFFLMISVFCKSF